MQSRPTAARNIVLALAMLVWAGLFITAAHAEQSGKTMAQSTEQAVAQWRNMKFGMFVHWGPVSLKGTEIGWSRGREVPVEEYDELYKRFNPTQFDAEAWVQVAKAAGMKYLVLTSKHHDGFCLWPSKYTDYHIGNTPFGRDVMRELADACAKHGIQFCTYHSICDWYHPDYPLGSPGGGTKKPHPNMPRYYEYLKNQTAEIVENYGPLGIMWFDGEWEEPWTREYGNELYAYLKALQPTLVVNNRVSKGRQGMAGITAQADLNAGDYDTPEQRVGGFNRQRPWETCMTICRQWAWKPNDTMKSTKECIQTLMQTVGGDGNLLFNVGPMPDGRIEPRQVERLQEMGAWLDRYGDGVYGTRGGPFKPGKWGASTCDGNTIWLYVMNWHTDDKLVLPPIDKTIVASRTLSDGTATVTQHGYGVEIEMPQSQQNEIATVIALDLDGPAFEIEPLDVPDEPAYLHAQPRLIDQWRDLKFGLFVHWGPVSLVGTEIGWSRGGERRGTGGTGQIPVDVYDNLYKEFDPTLFDADEWVQIAKDTGMQYLVFTTKHHDGFSMFDSQQTDYKITNSPFGRDVVKELADACHQAGLKLGFYYSPPDWHHPDYRTGNHTRYIDYMHGQVTELCTNYGQLDILWFDGLGGTAQDWDSHNLFKKIRTHQPEIIINNRAGLPADHDTPEQRVGKFQSDRPWETCMTICRQWAWKPDDIMKSEKECIQTLVRVVGGDGNLLFNVGPMPDGRIEPRQVERLAQMGRWLGKYGQTVYGTRGGPFKTTASLASTHQGNKIYVHILDWPEEAVTLPPLPKRIINATLLSGGALRVRQAEDAITIRVRPTYRDPIDTIVELTLDGPAADIEPLAIPSDSLAAGKPARASNVFQNNRSYGADKAFDDDPATRWATDSGTHAAWLEVDLGAPQTFSRVTISEAYDRVRRFELQYADAETWTTFYEGEKIGEDFSVDLDPITAQRVRLSILEATEGPTLWEFRLLPPKKTP